MGLCLRDHGLWAETRRDVPAGRGGLFLDRDGVIVEERQYLHRLEDVALTPDAASVIGQANRMGIPVVMITNQAGVGRGIYDWEAFDRVQAAIHAVLAAAGAQVDAVYACAYHEAGQGEYRVGDHPWRKPGPGMLLAAAVDLGVDLGVSWVVGDRATDLEAGRSAGLVGGTLVATGYGVEEREQVAAAALAQDGFRVNRAPNLAAIDCPMLVSGVPVRPAVGLEAGAGLTSPFT